MNPDPNPYRPVADSTLDRFEQTRGRCPHCLERFEITWARYWGSPFGRHTCPVCEGRFRIVMPLSQYAVGGLLAFFTIALLIVTMFTASISLRVFACTAVVAFALWLATLVAFVRSDRRRDQNNPTRPC